MTDIIIYVLHRIINLTKKLLIYRAIMIAKGLISKQITKTINITTIKVFTTDKILKLNTKQEVFSAKTV